MRVLLDTSVFLRVSAEPESLTRKTLKALEEAETAYLSIASMWEIAIKTSIGKVTLPLSAREYIRSRMEQLVIQPLDISFDHVAEVEALPFHHRDPFDRLIIAQSKIENLTVLTTDSIFKKYGVRSI